MAKPRVKRATAVAPGDHPRANLSMNDDVSMEVLRAAKAAGTLSQWASLSKQLCRLARSRLPVCLRIRDRLQAGAVTRSHAHGRLPFEGCTELSVSAPDLEMCCLVGGVLDAAQQWDALERLEVLLSEMDLWQRTAGKQQQQKEEAIEAQGAFLEHYATSLLMRVLPLQGLRHLSLTAPALGASSAHLILQLTQLTSLQLTSTATPAAAGPAADLSAMSAMTNLVELRLNWALAPHLPAGPEGPFCFPSSLVTLELSSCHITSPAPLACWVAHLPGCPHLQELELMYGREEQHSSTHPNHVAALLARHHCQLHSLGVYAVGFAWRAAVAGLPQVAGPAGGRWRPDASLAALKGLRSLITTHLYVMDEGDWHHMAQLTALTSLGGAVLHYAPPLPLAEGAALAVAQMGRCFAAFDGHGLGRLLLACPALRRAWLLIMQPDQELAPEEAVAPHPALTTLQVEDINEWGDAAAAAAQFAALAPVLSRVSQLELSHWPHPSSRIAVALPDLSGCTAVTRLVFGVDSIPDHERPPAPHQEDFLSMVAPLVQLQQLGVEWALWINPRIALVLQSMLPQLQRLELGLCGSLVPGRGKEEEEEEVLLKVRGLLRPGLELVTQS